VTKIATAVVSQNSADVLPDAWSYRWSRFGAAVIVAVAPVHFFLAALTGWFNRQQQDVVAYLVEENRVLRAQLRGRRVRLTDDQPACSPEAAS